MNIAVRLEGGIGDHLLANRFVHAIIDKYPHASFKFFSDTEGNSKQAEALEALWPCVYAGRIEVLKERKNKEFFIPSKFAADGKENYPAHLDNLPDSFHEEIKNFDKFYDLHIDGLKWMHYDFDWQRYFYFFPKVEANTPDMFKVGGEPFILCHLYARPNSPYNMEKWYVESLLCALSKDIKVVVVTTDEDAEYYKDIPNIKIVAPKSIYEVFCIAKYCTAFIGIDSGIRYIPYHFSKPTFVFSKYCPTYGQVVPSHLVRWLIFQYHVLPLHFGTDRVKNLINDALSHPAFNLLPHYSVGDVNIKNAIVDREL